MRPPIGIIVLLFSISLANVRATFPTWSAPSSNTPLRRMIVDSSTGNIYVAGKDAIFQFTSSPFQTSHIAKTGPLNDNKGCFPPDWLDNNQCFDNNFLTESLSNFNQILLLNESGDSILLCGNLRVGACNLRLASDVSTISMNDTQIFKAASLPAVEMIIVTRDEASNSAGVISYDYLGRPALFLVTHLPGLSSVKPSEISVRGMSSNDLLQPVVNDVNFPLKFPFEILSGFQSGEFVYFLAINPAPSGGGTLIARICRNDKGMAVNTLYAYLEAYIECKGSSKMYKYLQSMYVGEVGSLLAQNVGNSTVLMGAFNEKIDGTGASALCVISVAQIDSKYKQALENCRNGISGSRGFGLARDSTSKPCTNTLKTLWDGTGCSPTQVDISLEIPSSNPIVSSAFYEIPTASPSAALTAVAFTDVNVRDTVAFAGKGDGTVDKIDVLTNTSSQLVGNLSTGTSNKIISLEWSSDQSSIYALSEFNLTKIPAQECDTLTTCSSCLTPLDPYCGHCVLENKCTLSDTSVCEAASNPVRWIQNASDCINLVSISPKQASVAGTIQVTVNIENVPNVGVYRCMFGTGAETVATRITVGQEGFTCSTPSLTSGLQGQHEVQNPISIRSAATGDIIATSSDKFQLYDCSSYSDCFECTDSTLPCGWCTFSNRCTSSSGQCGSRTDWLQGSSDSCPQLIQGTYNWPVGITAWDFSIAGKNFPQPNPSQGDKYQCQVRVPGQPDVNVDATWISSKSVSCSATAYTYPDDSPTKEATLEVTWRGKVLENKDSTQLNLYKCDKMAVSCSDCLASERKYECGWCKNKCSVRAGCTSIFTTTAGSCPEPDIREVFPINGPVEGGTNVTIKGADIGIDISDINGVTIAGRQCSFSAATYTPGRSIVCTTSPVADSPSPLSPKTGPVVVQVNGRDYQFSQDFNYLVSSVSSFEPRLGPKAGGTRIEIKGENLHIGLTMSIHIHGVICSLGSRTLSAVDCTLGASPTATSGSLSLSIDNAELRDASSSLFQFTPNPTVTAITPSVGLAKGGIELTVEGTNLNSIQAPAVLFSRHDSPSSYRADCRKPTRANSMICFQPNVPANSSGGWIVSFEMDDVSPENLTLLNEFEIIAEDFTISGNDIDVTVGVSITISGTKLLKLKDLQDAIEIKFGTVAICNITDIANTAITCTPFPISDEPVGKDLPILISIGRYNTTGGRATISEGTGSVSVGLIAGIVGGVAAIAAVIIILVVYFSHKGRVQNKKYVSSLLIQMDRMEADMAKECKQGFAELQTDLDVIYEDAASLTTYVPLLKFRDFAFRVFFPNTADHDVLYPLQDRLNNMEPAAAKRLVTAMDMFRGLLGNKTFLAKMIHTMESERTFTMRDRGEVASLLMVIYQNQMDYATEILKMLLSDLIRSGVGRSQPKLLLRRTETVAEKLLTNWLSVCLHQYLEEVAGSPLYTLYLAVKNQIDKGPVDAITGESRYALSEEKLLRQQIEYKERRCSVLVEGQTNLVHVRLLDVDTISQAKEKCLDAVYKTTGVSSRPALHEVDLSVVSQSESSSRSSRNVLRLRDEDNSTRVESGWKRVNTLAHYNITDGTTLTLVSRDDVSKNGKVVDHTQMIVASPTQSVATLDDESGPRVWHLTKQVDTTTREHQKMVSEIYLTRMLSTKRIVQKFVDDVFDSMYAVAKVPFALKYLYDFLDSQAEVLNISDPDVLHTWKNNSVPLRFWMNVIKNPEFVFDVHKSVSVDSFLNIVASTFMDGCSVSEHKLSKESPSSKLLYNKEVQQYKQRVQRYYAEIKDQRKLTEADMKREMARISHLHGNEFHRDTALYQLSMYVLKYHSQLSNELLMDANLSKSLYKLLEALRA